MPNGYVSVLARKRKHKEELQTRSKLPKHHVATFIQVTCPSRMSELLRTRADLEVVVTPTGRVGERPGVAIAVRVVIVTRLVPEPDTLVQAWVIICEYTDHITYNYTGQGETTNQLKRREQVDVATTHHWPHWAW